MRPHAKDFDGAFRTIDLIDETMLNVDAARISAGQIADEFFVRRRILKWIFGEEIEQPLRLRFEICGRDFSRILLRLFCEDDRPVHQPGFVEVLSSGTLMPLRMDSRISGMETR